MTGSTWCENIQSLVFHCPPIYMFSERKIRKRPPRVQKVFSKEAFRHRDARTLLRDYCEPNRTPLKRGLYSGGVPVKQMSVRMDSHGRMGNNAIEYKPSPPRPQSSFNKNRWVRNGISKLHPRVLEDLLEQRHSESPRIVATPRSRNTRFRRSPSICTSLGMIEQTPESPSNSSVRPMTSPLKTRRTEGLYLQQDSPGVQSLEFSSVRPRSPRKSPRVPPLQITSSPLFRSPSPRSNLIRPNSSRSARPPQSRPSSPRFVPSYGNLDHHKLSDVSYDKPRFLH